MSRLPIDENILREAMSGSSSKKQIEEQKILNIRKEIAEECVDAIDKYIENFIKINCKQISPWNLRYHVKALRNRVLDTIRGGK